MPLPLRLEGRDIYNDAAARVGGFADADGEHLARDAEVFHAAGEGEGIGRHDAHIGFHVHKGAVIEGLRVHHASKNICENFELVRNAEVVAVARKPVADDALAGFGLLDLTVHKGLDHAAFNRHAADPFVGAN